MPLLLIMFISVFQFLPAEAAWRNPPHVQITILDASWCPYCRELRAALSEIVAGDSVPMRIFGQDLSAHIRYVNFDEMSPADFEREGFERDGTPQMVVSIDEVPVVYVPGLVRGRMGQKLNGKQLLETLERGIVEETGNYQLLTSWKASTSPQALRVTLFGTGASAEDRPYGVGWALTQIKDYLIGQLGVDSQALTTLYGGASESECIAGFICGDTLATFSIAGYSVPYFTSFTNLEGQGPFQRDTLASRISESGHRNHLIVSLGHGSSIGVEENGGALLTPALFQKMVRELPEQNIVMVNGNCHGGIFAPVVNCGFFAARPEGKAQGCWTDPGYDDKETYPVNFFLAQTPPYRDQADISHDGKVSFHEAHLFAADRVNKEDVPFTSYDDLVDRNFLRVSMDSPVLASKSIDLQSLDLGEMDRQRLDDFLEKYKLLLLSQKRVEFEVEGEKWKAEASLSGLRIEPPKSWRQQLTEIAAGRGYALGFALFPHREKDWMTFQEAKIGHRSLDESIYENGLDIYITDGEIVVRVKQAPSVKDPELAETILAYSYWLRMGGQDQITFHRLRAALFRRDLAYFHSNPYLSERESKIRACEEQSLDDLKLSSFD